jgi:heme exporter protein B
MTTLRMAWLITLKDLRVEWRTKEIIVTTALFGVLVVILSSLSFYLNPTMSRRVAPGVLWVAIAFAGVLSLGRSWGREKENDAIRGLLLSPIPRPSIYLGKWLSGFILLCAIEVILIPLVAVFFHLDLIPVAGRLTAIVGLGTAGFVAAGTLFSALSARGGARDLLLSVVVFPLIAPALLSAVVATRELLAGAPLEETLEWLRVLGAFDIVFLAGGYALFGPVISE